MISIMTESEFDALFSQIKPVERVQIRVETGDCVFRRGDSPEGIYRVESGEVLLVRHSHSGQMLTLHRAQAGQLFAEASLFSESCHCDAVAERDSTLTRFNKGALLELLASSNADALRWMSYFAREIQNLRKQVEIVSTRSASERVWLHLQHLGNTQHEIEPGFVIRKLADEIALTPEAYSRALKTLVDQRRVIRQSNGSLKLS